MVNMVKIVIMMTYVHMSLDKIKELIDDDSEAFGHGLCLVYCLLIDV